MPFIFQITVYCLCIFTVKFEMILSLRHFYFYLGVYINYQRSMCLYWNPLKHIQCIFCYTHYVFKGITILSNFGKGLISHLYISTVVGFIWYYFNKVWGGPVVGPFPYMEFKAGLRRVYFILYGGGRRLQLR